MTDRWKRRLKWVAAMSAIAIALGLGVSYWIAGRLVAACPQDIGVPPPDFPCIDWRLTRTDHSENTTRQTPVQSIAGWRMTSKADRGNVLLLHGIRGNRTSMQARAKFLRRAGWGVYLIDLPSHGESDGDQITLGFDESKAVADCVTEIRRLHPGQSLAVIGVSLGGASFLLSDADPVDAVILESVYSTVDRAIDNRVSGQIGFLSPLPSWLLKIQIPLRLKIARQSLRPIDRASRLRCPVFWMGGKYDVHTTPVEVRAMYDATSRVDPPAKQLWLVPGAGHVDLHQHDPRGYERRVLRFLDEHL